MYINSNHTRTPDLYSKTNGKHHTSKQINYPNGDTSCYKCNWVEINMLTENFVHNNEEVAILLYVCVCVCVSIIEMASYNLVQESKRDSCNWQLLQTPVPNLLFVV